MILRALFWIAVVSVLMPREPDLGFGPSRRAGFHGAIGNDLGDGALSARQALHAVTTRRPAVSALSALDSVQSVAVRSLAQVKADIEDQERERVRLHAADQLTSLH